MNPADLLQAIPGLLLAALLPGFALAMLIAPRWRFWEWLAVSAGLSAGFLGLLGLAYHHARVPFEPATVYPVVVVVGGLGFLRWMLARRHSLKVIREVGRGTSVAVACAGLLAGLASAAALAYSLHDQALPPDVEAPQHGTLVNLIVQTHDAFPSIAVAFQHAAYLRPRVAFEATAALVSMTFGPAPAYSMMPVVMVAVVLLPLGLAMLALEVTRSSWVAVLAPLLSTGMAFPSFQIELGRLPAVMDATLVAAALVAVARLLRGREPTAHALFLTAAGAAITATNGLEAFTALYLAVPLVIELLISQRSLQTLLRAAAGGVASGAGVLLPILLWRTLTGPPAQVIDFAPLARPNDLFTPGGTGIQPRVVLDFFAQTDLNSPIAIGLIALGIAAALARVQLLWALAALLLLLVAVADSFYTNWFGWQSVSPWADPDRLLGIAYWVVPLLMALGLVSGLSLAIQSARLAKTWAGLTLAAMAAIAAVAVAWAAIDREWMKAFQADVSPYPWLPMRQLSGLSQWVVPILVTTLILGGTWIMLRFLYLTEPGGPRRAMASRTSVAVLASIAIGLLSLGLGVRQEMNTFDGVVRQRQLVTAADLAVMDSMSQALPSGARVLADGRLDGGMWIAAVTHDTVLVPSGYAGGGSVQTLLTAVANVCADPAAVAHVMGSFDLIFIGSHLVGGGPPAWNAQCLAAVPGLKEVARASSPGGDAHLFAVIRPAAR